MSAPSLKPCPICGEANYLIIDHLEGTTQRPAYRVLCDNCGCSSRYCDGGYHVEAWNDRLADPNEQSKIERIKAEILSNDGYFIDDGEGTYGNFHSEESIIKIIDRISNENDVPVIGGDS